MIIDVSLACGEACFFCKANDQWHLGRNGQWMSCRTARSLMKSDEVWWSLMKSDEVWWSLMKSDEVWWSLMKSDEVWWSLMKSDEVWWSLMKSDEVWCANLQRLPSTRPEIQQKFAHLPLGHPGSSNICALFPRKSPQLFGWRASQLLWWSKKIQNAAQTIPHPSKYIYIYMCVRLLLYCQWRHQEMPRTWNLMTNFQHRNVQRMPREPRVV